MIVSLTKSTAIQKISTVLPDNINVTSFGLFSFVCGLPTLYILNLMGELYATEVLLPVFTLILLFSGKEKRIFQEKIFWKFVLSMFLMIVGYMISDLVAGTSQFNYLRGWGRNAILFSDIVCLSIIASTDKRYIWWYVFGASIGAIFFLQINGVSFTNANWKLAYSQPILLLILVFGYFFSYLKIFWLTLAVGLFSFFMDSRSFSTICILVTGIILMRRGNPETLNISTKSLFKMLIAGAIAGLIILSVLAQTNEDFSKRRDISSVERFAALRIALIAISDSPILGYGSWGEGTKVYAAMLYKETKDIVHQLGQNNYQQEKTFLAHSQILQSWMEGGIFAAQLFIFYGFQLLFSLKKVILNRRLDYMTTLYSFFLISAFWGLFMSPYSGGHRLGIAIAIAIICSVNVETSSEIIKK